MKRTSLYQQFWHKSFNALVLAILFSASTVSSSCANSNSELANEPTPQPVERKDIVLTKNEEALVTATNTFAFQALATLGDDDDNVLFSPLSLSMLMGILQNGAAGDTQSQIINTLGFGGLTPDEVNTYYRKMLTAAATLDPQVKLAILMPCISRNISLYIQLLWRQPKKCTIQKWANWIFPKIQ